MNGDEFIDGWYARLRGPVTDALAFLASCEATPTSDGILADWIDTLVALRFVDHDVPFIAQLIDSHDPHLQEAGVRLARAALRHVDGNAAFEPPLARLTSREIDLWVLESVIELLTHTRYPFTTVYEGLVANHGRTPQGWGIKRNKLIEPWRRLVRVYEQHAIQTLRPKPRDLTYLPILEREYGTGGWEPTVGAILTRLGYDPELHFQRLRTL